MEKFATLLGYFDKQFEYVRRIHQEILAVDLSNYLNRYFFAARAQQFYTAMEDLLKQIAKAFENHVENTNSFHKELLTRMNVEIPKIRPAVLSQQSFLMLDKVRSFRHFFRHAYDCELDEAALRALQTKIRDGYSQIENDLLKFRSYVEVLSTNDG